MADTTWLLADHNGRAMAVVANASVKQFQGQRNRPRQGTLTLTHDDDETGVLLNELANGTPQLRYFRDGTLRLSALLTSIAEGVSEDDGSDTLVATFKDPWGVMLGDGSETGRFLTAAYSPGSIDQGAAGWGLINSLTAPLVSEGSVPATANIAPSWAVGQNVGQALVDLTAQDGGIDIEFLPLDPSAVETPGLLATYNVYESQGSDKPSVAWGFGAPTHANVRQVSRNITPPVNRVRMTTSDGLVSEQTDAASILKHGEWGVELQAPAGVTSQATLDALAAGQLRSEWVKVVTFQPDPDLYPKVFDDFWLGDTGRFVGDQGAFDETFSPRVNGVTITEDDSGVETLTLAVEVGG